MANEKFTTTGHLQMLAQETDERIGTMEQQFEQRDAENDADLDSHITNKSNPHGVTKSQVGLGNVDNTSDANKPVSTAQATAIAAAKKAGTDAQTNLDNHTGSTSNPHSVTKSQVGLGNVPNVATNDQTPTYSAASTLATLTSGEKLSVSMGKIMKAISDLILHIANTVSHITATERNNWNSAKTHADSTHAPAGAEVNQNAFSKIVVGSTTIEADAKTDALNLAGSNVTLTPDASNDKLTIGITKANVTSALGFTPSTKAKTVSITIATSAWKSNADATTKNAGFLYYADAAVSGITAEDYAETILDISSLDAAINSGLAPVTDISAGSIRYYAVAIPAAALSAQVCIIQGES